MTLPISEIVATTLRNRSARLADNVTNNNALLMRLKQRGNVRPVDGGRTIDESLLYGGNDTFKRYSGYELIDISPTHVMTLASYDWKQAAVTVTISGLEELQNSGRSRVHDLLRGRIMEAEAQMENNIAADVFSDGTADGGKQITGIQAQIVQSPASGTVGGIPRNTNSWWRNKIGSADFSDAAKRKANVKGAMEGLWVQLIRGTDKPDLITADNNMYTGYWESLQDQQRFTDKNMADGGFENLRFNTAPVVLTGGHGGAAPENKMHFLNTKYLHFRPSRNRNMKVQEGDRAAVNQDAIVKMILWAGNMTMSNASLQGVLFSTA